MGVVLDNLDLLAKGFWLTLQVSVASYVLAVLLGTLIATMRVSPVAPLRAAGLFYVETVRNTPLAVVFVLAFFGLPKVAIRGEPFVTAIAVLAVYHAAFVSEALRSGINAVATGQAEAARSIGLTFGQTLRFVVLPQAFRTVVPPLGNIFIAQTKNSSVALSISLFELTSVASRLITDYSRPVAVLFGIAIAYMIITLPAGLLFEAVERRVRIVR